MGLRVLLDSVILIDHFNAVAAATSYLRSARGDAAISVITRAEVLAGFNHPAPEAVIKILDSFPNLIIDTAVATLAAQLRRANNWKLPDALQAALAQQHGLTLATRNTRDFKPAEFAFVEVPYAVP